jgi:hypothetical protein
VASVNVPGGLAYDTVRAPLEVCCGVFDQLARLDGPPPPMAQLGDAMLFMVRRGSAESARASLPVDCAILGIEFGDGASQRDSAVPDSDSCLWLVPPVDHSADLPPASTVVAAICAAYAATRPAVGAP